MRNDQTYTRTVREITVQTGQMGGESEWPHSLEMKGKPVSRYQQRQKGNDESRESQLLWL